MGIVANLGLHRGKHARRRRIGLWAASVVVLAAVGLLAAFLPGALRKANARSAGGPVSVPGPVPEAVGAGGFDARPDVNLIDVGRLEPGQAGWVVAENRKKGTKAWFIAKDASADIEGFADHVSAEAGDRITLYVSTRAARFRVQAFRLGYYQGLGARFLWGSTWAPGGMQAEPTVDPSTNMVEAHWKPSLTLTVGYDWPQGDYLLKLIGGGGEQSYVSLTVRDDESHAALVIQNSVTTWQAYNDWGGHSLYNGPGGYSDRSRIVSFDRPYAIGNGAGSVIGGNERPVIALVEKLGLDVTYWTDIDLHARPDLLLNHRALISLGHDEYWSSEMRDGALQARDQGVNLVFLGANADFRHIRMEDSPLGTDRHEVDYKSASEDPMTGVNDAEVTVSWRNAPVPRPESELNGALYECNPVSADMVVAHASNWLFAGTGLQDGDRLPDLVGSEYDRVQSYAPTPQAIEILAHSPVSCRGQASYSDMTYYTTKGGAGVFDSGTSLWTTDLGISCVLQGSCGDRAEAIVRVTENLLRACTAGPAGKKHPATSNLSEVGIELTHPLDP